jgi:2'-5' RNA ligase
MERVRIFIAFSLPKQTLDAIEDLSKAFQKKFNYEYIRWIPTENIHLTMKFLGEQNKNKVDSITETIGAIATKFSVINVKMTQMNIFPNINRARGLWIEILDYGDLKHLAESIDSHLAINGFTKSKRPFHPHITIARFRSKVKRSELGKLAQNIPSSIPVPVQSVVLKKLSIFESELHPSGAKHTVLSEYALADDV